MYVFLILLFLNQINAKVALHLLARMGHRVEHVENGADALQRWRNSWPDLKTPISNRMCYSEEGGVVL